MSYSDLDELAYNFYVNACKYDKCIIDDFVGHIDRFIQCHNEHYNNLSYYYNLANIEIRKIKLNKLCLMQEIK